MSYPEPTQPPAIKFSTDDPNAKAEGPHPSSAGTLATGPEPAKDWVDTGVEIHAPHAGYRILRRERV